MREGSWCNCRNYAWWWCCSLAPKPSRVRSATVGAGRAWGRCDTGITGRLELPVESNTCTDMAHEQSLVDQVACTRASFAKRPDATPFKARLGSPWHRGGCGGRTARFSMSAEASKVAKLSAPPPAPNPNVYACSGRTFESGPSKGARRWGSADTSKYGPTSSNVRGPIEARWCHPEPLPQSEIVRLSGAECCVRRNVV